MLTSLLLHLKSVYLEVYYDDTTFFVKDIVSLWNDDQAYIVDSTGRRVGVTRTFPLRHNGYGRVFKFDGRIKDVKKGEVIIPDNNILSDMIIDGDGSITYNSVAVVKVMSVE